MQTPTDLSGEVQDLREEVEDLRVEVRRLRRAISELRQLVEGPADSAEVDSRRSSAGSREADLLLGLQVDLRLLRIGAFFWSVVERGNSNQCP